MDIRKVKKLIELLDESGIAEIEITEGEESVRISRHPQGGTMLAAPAAPAPVMTAAPAAAAPVPAAPAAAPAPAAPAEVEDEGYLVKSANGWHALLGFVTRCTAICASGRSRK